jgi:tetratricopeptide (TPR) repeat protein
LENYLGVFMVQAKDYQAAKYHFEKSVKLLPHDTNLFNLGSTYENLKDYNNATIYYQNALDVKNKYSTHTDVRRVAYEGLGRLTLLYSHLENIDPRIQTAVKEFPNNGTFWAYLAINQYFIHQDKEALASAKKAKDLLPNQYTDRLYERILNKQEIKLQ